MAPPPRPPPSGMATASEEVGLTAGEDGADQYDDFMEEEPNVFNSNSPRLTGERWNLFFHCEGAHPDKEYVEIVLDRASISLFQLLCIKSKLGYSSRDFLFYKKRCGRDVATLEAIEFEKDAESMIQNSEGERKVKLLLTRDQPTELRVSVTPIKRPRESKNIYEPNADEPIDAYKVWLANLQAKAEEEGKELEFKDDYREDTINTYREWLRHRRELSDILSYAEEDMDGVHTHPEEENHENNPSSREWPSHARLPKKKGKEGGNKYGRGTLKGFSVAKTRIKSGTQKLKIAFSEKLGGPIGPNARAFVDEVVMFTRKRAPVIGVRSWKDIKQNVKNSIAIDILDRWDFQNIDNATEKIWDIASDRYRGWRSTFSATYKAYNNYDERMKKHPEDLDIAEWHYLMLYFGTEKFQKLSNKNSGNRQQQKTKHLMGTKTFSRISDEKRDPQTGEEPSDLALFQMTHMKNGEWSNTASKDVYENACKEMCQRELQVDRLLSTEEENNIFQSTYNNIIGCKSSKLHGHGYLAKYPTRRQLMEAQIEEHARASAAAHQKNLQLESKVQQLEEQLANEAIARRQIQEDEQKAREVLREQLREELKKEMLSIMTQQREEILQPQPQASLETIIPREHETPPAQGIIRKTRISKVNEMSPSYISPHQLRNAVKTRVRTRSEQDDTL